MADELKVFYHSDLFDAWVLSMAMTFDLTEREVLQIFLSLCGEMCHFGKSIESVDIKPILKQIGFKT